MTTRTLTVVRQASVAANRAPSTLLDETTAAEIERLEAMSFRGLRRMFSPRDEMFVFRVRPTGAGVIQQEGLSPRYTAIALIGLARYQAEQDSTVPGAFDAVVARLLQDAAKNANLGDVALSLWAGKELGADDATLEPVLRQLEAVDPLERPQPVVELAWTLSALSALSSPQALRLRERVASRLMSAFSFSSKLFPHIVGGPSGVRAHVSCFADIIYPIQALSRYAAATRHQMALDVASACAAHLCSLQGEAGQWWWHYDFRTGRVLERYPVYAIHQDAMGPMGLRTLREAGGLDCSAAINLGMRWLTSSPELAGGSLVDDDRDLIWRKVARREPRKLVRALQSGLSRAHSSLRVPAVDVLFPPGEIDYEDRPYHLGWLLYAWSAAPLIPEPQLGEQ